MDIGDELVTVMEFVEGRPLTDVIQGSRCRLAMPCD